MNISFADIGIWCNGNTTDSGPVIPGSSPGIPTIKKFYFKFGIWCNGNTTDSGPVIPGSSPGIPTHTVRHLSVMKGVFFVYRNSVLWSIHNDKPQSFRPGVYCIYFFSASIALIFCFTISRSVLSFSILRFISSTRLLHQILMYAYHLRNLKIKLVRLSIQQFLLIRFQMLFLQLHIFLHMLLVFLDYMLSQQLKHQLLVL